MNNSWYNSDKPAELMELDGDKKCAEFLRTLKFDMMSVNVVRNVIDELNKLLDYAQLHDNPFIN